MDGGSERPRGRDPVGAGEHPVAEPHAADRPPGGQGRGERPSGAHPPGASERHHDQEAAGAEERGGPQVTERFSDRVEDYVRYRPTYPAAALDLLARECGLAPGAAVADLGSGTGILTALLLDRGARVFAVEPNEPMRRAAEAWLGRRPGFTSVAGTAEATGLPAASVDLVTAAQAFHWFDPARTRAQAARILRPGGRVAILWNDRRKGTTPFLAAYEELLLAWGTDYRQVDHSRIGPHQVAAFFGGAYASARFDHHQRLDRQALLGRLRSSSYFPAPGDPRHAAAMAAAAELFETHRDPDGQVTIEYDTRVHWGEIHP